LGAKAIKKLRDQDTEDGDIEAGSIIHVLYDGTNWQMQTPQATMPTTAILSEMSTFFGATNISGAEAETLTDGSNAESLHTHTGNVVASSTTEPKVTNPITNLTPILAQSNGFATNTVQTYTKLKEIVAGRSGTVIVGFTLTNDGASTFFGRIYVNGVAVGTERSSADTFLEEVTIVRSDLIQIYGRSGDGGQMSIANFRIYAKAIEGFSVNL
jgi:hypothetical protein